MKRISNETKGRRKTEFFSFFFCLKGFIYASVRGYETFSYLGTSFRAPFCALLKVLIFLSYSFKIIIEICRFICFRYKNDIVIKIVFNSVIGKAFLVVNYL